MYWKNMTYIEINLFLIQLIHRNTLIYNKIYLVETNYNFIDLI